MLRLSNRREKENCRQPSNQTRAQPCVQTSARFSTLAEENGSAALEFLSIGLILLVPLIYLVLVISNVQAASLAVEGASRQAARVFAESSNGSHGRVKAQKIIEYALADFGLASANRQVSFQCLPAGQRCLQPGGTVSVSIKVRVALPLVPEVLSLSEKLAVPIEAASSSAVSRFANVK